MESIAPRSKRNGGSDTFSPDSCDPIFACSRSRFGLLPRRGATRQVLRGLITVTVIAVNILPLAAPLAAHEDLEIQIERATRQLAENPRSAELHFKRAELFREHADWTNATRDYATAIKLNPELLAAHRGRGLMHLESGHPELALADLDYLLTSLTNDWSGLSIRGRVLHELKRYPESARNFDCAIRFSPNPQMNDFLGKARALGACGIERIPEALATVDDGLTRFGPAAALQNLGIELELARSNFTNALARLDASMSGLPRREWWQARRGELLEQAGRTAEAREAFEQSLVCIRALPPRTRQIGAVQDLERRVTERLQKSPPSARDS